MKRFLMLVAFLTALAACSSEYPTAPNPQGNGLAGSSVASIDKQSPPEAGGEKSRPIKYKWPLVPGWDTVYGPEGCVDARIKRTWQDILKLQSAVEQFREDGYPCYPNHPYAEVNEAGRSMMDYMPRRGRVINTFSGVEAGINWGCYPTHLGEICYMNISDRDGYSVGYEILALNAERDNFLRISHVDSSLIGGP